MAGAKFSTRLKYEVRSGSRLPRSDPTLSPCYFFGSRRNTLIVVGFIPEHFCTEYGILDWLLWKGILGRTSTDCLREEPASACVLRFAQSHGDLRAATVQAVFLSSGKRTITKTGELAQREYKRISPSCLSPEYRPLVTCSSLLDFLISRKLKEQP